MAEITGFELIERKFVEGGEFGHSQIFGIGGGLPKSEIKAQPIDFRATFGAVLVGTPAFGHSTGDKKVFRLRDVLPGGLALLEETRIRGGVVEIHHAAQAGEVAVDVIAGAAFDDGGDLFGEMAITIVFGGDVKIGEALGLLRPANVAGSKMRGAKFIANILGEHERSDTEKKIT